MLPKLSELSPVQQEYQAYLRAVKAAGFRGELAPDYATRTVLSTDNSIYQVLPQAVVFPCDAEDIQILTRLANTAPYENIVLSARGGGTGTNGQSLTDGIVVDLSRHMNRILEINAKERWVRVQTGVVKDQLNAALKPHGLFFAPELSTSNRATIGGMINTDASGQGSVAYGKTRDHVLELTTVLGDGTVLHSQAMSDVDLETYCSKPGRVGEIHRTVCAIWNQHESAIKAKFPPLNRCLTGYDLAHIRDEEGHFNLNNILCGSEGTLGFITEAKLNLLVIPKTSALVNVFYDSFESSLRDAQALMSQQPTSIETVDNVVLNLAKGDIVWHSVKEYFPDSAGDIQGINLVEYTAESDEELNAKINTMAAHLNSVQGQPGQPTGYSIARGTDAVNKVWGMRKKSVGLLGNAKGEARPIPFVEDTAVPPENLADFIMEFRAVLDGNNLKYGMFGHVDCGVLHVRPMLDMKDPAQALQVRVITEKVVALVRKYNGLLWGEHGKGVRSEFAPEFFGELYPVLQQIKAVFDPRNQFNPGKIATPQADIALLKIDEVTMRGELDSTIPVQVWDQFSDANYCNGNGACHNWNPDDFMCPSWKATRDRRQTPKGRASLIREWERQLADRGISTTDLTAEARSQSALFTLPGKLFRTLSERLARRRGDTDFNQEIHDSMMGCLACKSCTGQCPIKVNVPEFRSRFLEIYYSRYLRPLKDYFIGSLEYVIPFFAPVRGLYNVPMRSAPVKWLLAKTAGMVDSPLISRTNLKKAITQRNIPWANAQTLAELSVEQRAKAVILVQDAFTTFFDTDTVLDVLNTLQKLGFYPLVMPFQPNGKPLHVHGFHRAFERAAKNHTQWLQGLSGFDIPFIGVDPSMALTFRSEYRKLLGDDAVPDVLLVQEFLAQRLPAAGLLKSDEPYYLLAHCTESTNAAPSIRQWQQVFASQGFRLEILSAGCCGMAGTYGHETRNRANSEAIYDQSWRRYVEDPAKSDRLVASGYSCRTQSKRLSDTTLPHPLSLLNQLL
ncbi:FAD-binding and (Fe-S)-binding domain-containing protein [Salinispirillum marinum]|uniref:FAD-binding and (Fe-S)-binding domain-containing protein n=2 Tax=Saccharospirillaceae TaxID=255527 RepID=A0ABV8BHM9_9GAMM